MPVFKLKDNPVSIGHKVHTFQVIYRTRGGGGESLSSICETFTSTERHCCTSTMQTSGAEHDDSFDFLFKIILIGESNVGKTCLVQNFKSGIFSERQQNTIGVDFTVRTVDIDGRRVKVSALCLLEGVSVEVVIRI